MNIKKYLISVILATSLIACNNTNTNTNNNTDKAKDLEIKKTYTTAEQHQIWKDEISKLVPSGYQIEYNFDKIESMIAHHKEAEICFVGTQNNFQKYTDNLQNNIDPKIAFETFAEKAKIIDEICSELVMDEMYGDCSNYSLNAIRFFEYSIKGDAKKAEYYKNAFQDSNFKCSMALSMYKIYEDKKHTPTQHKLAIFAGGNKPPFNFCNSSDADGTQKYYCKITDFQKNGLVSKFE